MKRGKATWIFFPIVTATFMILIVLLANPESAEAGHSINWTQNGAVTDVQQDSSDILSKNEVRTLLEENQYYSGLEETPGPWRKVTVLNPEPVKRVYNGKIDILKHRDNCWVGRPDLFYGKRYESGYPDYAWFKHKAEIRDGSRRVLKEVMGRNQLVEDEKQCPKGVLFAEEF